MPEIPYDEYMQLACGCLGWKPKDFWESSPWEFHHALNGYNRKNGGNKSKPMTRNEYLDLKERCKHNGNA